MATISFESLDRRFKSRLRASLSLARAYRFVSELEPRPNEEPDPFVVLSAALRTGRHALRADDDEAALDGIERIWIQLEACREQVTVRDAPIQAYRVRWACENAPLRHQTIDSLGRFYRLLPSSASSQSKYEYVLTRLLAGPIGPERKLALTQELIDAVVALEASWGVAPVTVDEEEVATILLAIRSFAYEARRHSDAATFMASALLRRFGAFKASIGAKLFDPRLSVAAVETNVAVLNVLNQLLADAGGRPLKWDATTNWEIRRDLDAQPSDPVPVATAIGFESAAAIAVAAVPEGSAPKARPDLRTGEVDLSGLDFVRSRRKQAQPPASETAATKETVATSDAKAAPTDGEAPPAVTPPVQIRTGEVNLAGLEIVGRARRPKPDSEAALQDPSADQEADHEADEHDDEDRVGDIADPVEAGAALSTGVGPLPVSPGPLIDLAPASEIEQQPSLRALDLEKQPENAAIIGRYLTRPRSPEVWQLDLDVFLSSYPTGDKPEANATERRRALDLILAADDLICVRANQEGAPSPEHKARVKTIANAMLLLRTSLRRAADGAQREGMPLEPLLYASDHVLWERLRLEASLKRNPRRRRSPLLPRTNQVAEAALLRTRSSRRDRRILISVVGVAAALTIVAGILGVAVPRIPVHKDVRLIQLSDFPGAQLFDEARGFKNTLFISASRTWSLLGKEERRSVVRALGKFAAERGFSTVSVIGPRGEPWATFKNDEVVLDGESGLPTPTNR